MMPTHIHSKQHRFSEAANDSSNNLVIEQNNWLLPLRSNPRWWTGKHGQTCHMKRARYILCLKKKWPLWNILLWLAIILDFLLALLQLLKWEFKKANTSVCSRINSPAAPPLHLPLPPHHLVQPCSWDDSSLHEYIFKWWIFRGLFLKQEKEGGRLFFSTTSLIYFSSLFYLFWSNKTQWCFGLLNVRLICNSPLHNERPHNWRASASFSPSNNLLKQLKERAFRVCCKISGLCLNAADGFPEAEESDLLWISRYLLHPSMFPVITK